MPRKKKALKQGRKKVRPKRKPRRSPSDGFITVARRLEVDQDKAAFEAKLGKFAKAKPTERQ